MPRKDRFHDLVKQALIQTGWVITDDPLYLTKIIVYSQITQEIESWID
jgi:hypothetical protein